MVRSSEKIEELNKAQLELQSLTEEENARLETLREETKPKVSELVKTEQGEQLLTKTIERLISRNWSPEDARAQAFNVLLSMLAKKKEATIHAEIEKKQGEIRARMDVIQKEIDDLNAQLKDLGAF